MISQKPKKIILLGIVGISFVGIILSSGELNSCGIQHVSLLNDIKTFEQNEDPEFCEKTVNKILNFNEQCEPYIEILDCG
ncbi:MAG: hypothetical protein ACE5RN_02695 [Nitrosopumilaceae archaeon]